MFERDLDPERAIVATTGDQLLGIAGVHHDGRQLTAVPMRSIIRTFGLVGGTVKALVLGVLFDRKPRKGELVMDGIAVHAEARGRGVGTKLLEEVIAYAGELQFRAVRLDVIDTNPRARALYERFGFVAERTEQTPYLRRWLGFGAATTMIRSIAGVSSTREVARP
jgi:ribosomal protein S18 acetylase RimI-like enzyme